MKSSGNKVGIAVFISGTGTNLKNLINFSKKNNLFKVKLVISNKRNAKGLIFAKKNRINTKVYYLKAKLKDERKILNNLKKIKLK